VLEVMLWAEMPALGHGDFEVPKTFS